MENSSESEDVRRFLETLLQVAGNWAINPETLEESHIKAAALITADRERIRRECAEIAVSAIYVNTDCDDANNLRQEIINKASRTMGEAKK